MNRGGLQETMMLHCLNKSGGVSISNIAELTVLERQRSGTKWQMQQGLVQGGDQLQGQMCKDSNHQPASIPLVKPESVLEKTCAGLSNYGMASVEDFESCGYPEDSVIDYNYQKMKSYPAVSIVDESSGGKDSVLTATEGGKKRKADRALKVASGSNTTEMKKIKEWAGDEESKVTQHRRSTNHKVKNKNKAGDAFIDASTVSQVQRTDYIHVRARRGEATDSHSLAERVRRERISERMKYLQELVPGCNKITGKAGMLDEIINYVQSLQRQVEFLSMKLATVNPQLNYSIDSLFAKEVVTPCTSSYPTLGELSEMANPAYLQFNLLEEVVSSGMDVGNYQPEMGVQQQLPEEHIDTTAFHVIILILELSSHVSVLGLVAYNDDLSTIQQTPSPWEAELHNLLAMEFQGGSMSFPSQPVTGSTETRNRKMEI